MHEILRDRLHAIAYHALWQLRDLGPAEEPPYFKMTRLDLHDRLGPPPPGHEAPARHLRPVP